MSKMPGIIYGTAWKKDRTQALVRQAILAGFRGVDTAAQPKHYQERLVGCGLRDGMEQAGLGRGDIYVQTKFTSVSGQDPKSVPYDLRSSITEQVTTSVASSLRNLAGLSGYAEEAFVDCLVLHSPFPTQPQTAEAWRAMEAHVPHSARTLGISNVYHLPTLRWLYEFAIIKPAVVQNRFYRETNYDIAIRAFCAENGMVYQSFWTLTANPQLVRSKLVGDLAEIVGVSSVVALYALVSSLGNVSILNGTTNARHMVEDLVGLSKVAAWANTNEGDWKSLQVMFAELLRV
ncbi:aldo-keto reductase (AKR) [Teratosphaeria destructans]|uniref:Aldo-keto reductase (AKR) n=1 Tax=Teratosphaeria destructans TaxID=418781 RepID=A0A9W7SN47_9PEZI|nr:aldo-keto reductase (AKR) [Teratosphaeria destructans]